MVADGPLAEAREQPGGCHLIVHDSLRAIQIDEEIPPARLGTVETCPVMKSRANRRIVFADFHIRAEGRKKQSAKHSNDASAGANIHICPITARQNSPKCR